MAGPQRPRHQSVVILSGYGLPLLCQSGTREIQLEDFFFARRIKDSNLLIDKVLNTDDQIRVSLAHLNILARIEALAALGNLAANMDGLAIQGCARTNHRHRAHHTQSSF